MAPSINEIFDKIKAGVEADPSLVKKVRILGNKFKDIFRERRPRARVSFLHISLDVFLKAHILNHNR